MATKFKDFIREIEEEARVEGPDAVAELEALRTHFRLGRQLAAARRAQRLSQKEVATRAGIDQADVSDLERGAGNPTLSRLEAVATAVGMRLELTSRRTSLRKAPPAAPRRTPVRTR
ncbi:MAG TPA: helix-turn-helix domain-containing protein [Myxococcaceae bacterium]|jgi:predicted XRE-type DNA-binding protein